MMNWMRNLLVAAAAFLAAGCERSDGERGSGGEVSPQVLAAFAERYPGAQNVSWSMKGDYAVADFYWTGTRAALSTNCSAWFGNADGRWTMTETEIRFEALPQAVREAFAASEYASWRVDDRVDVLYRAGDVEPEIYVIEVEQGGREMDLYYSPDGVLVKCVADADPDCDYGDFIPAEPAASIGEYIRTHYPSARVIDVDAESEGTEVEILDGGVKRELFFDRGAAWQYTKTGVRRADLPEAVTAAWAASEYAGWEFDGADYLQTPDGAWYVLELEEERTDREVTLRIAEDGTILG